MDGDGQARWRSDGRAPPIVPVDDKETEGVVLCERGGG